MRYDSSDMAIAAILWLKTKKGCYLHCTEYGYAWRADAIGSNGDMVYEVEVKTSWSDFQADFRNKVRKHETYNSVGKTSRYNYKPNYLYYLVPRPLSERVAKFLKENEQYKKYGVLYMDDRGEIWSAKSVKKLHDTPIAESVKTGMISRMSNEYIYLIKQLKGDLRNKVNNFFDELLQDASQSFERVSSQWQNINSETELNSTDSSEQSD